MIKRGNEISALLTTRSQRPPCHSFWRKKWLVDNCKILSVQYIVCNLRNRSTLAVNCWGQLFSWWWTESARGKASCPPPQYKTSFLSLFFLLYGCFPNSRNQLISLHHKLSWYSLSRGQYYVDYMKRCNGIFRFRAAVLRNPRQHH